MNALTRSPQGSQLWHVRQPPGSSLCGHACVATVLGITLDRAVALIGHKHGTKAKELGAVLRALGVSCDLVRTRKTKNAMIPMRALCALSAPGKRRRFHWVLLWDGIVHDPEFAWPMSAATYMSCYDDFEEAFSSFLEIG